MLGPSLSNWLRGHRSFHQDRPSHCDCPPSFSFWVRPPRVLLPPVPRRTQRRRWNKPDICGAYRHHEGTQSLAPFLPQRQAAKETTVALFNRAFHSFVNTPPTPTQGTIGQARSTEIPVHPLVSTGGYLVLSCYHATVYRRDAFVMHMWRAFPNSAPRVCLPSLCSTGFTSR